MTRGFFFFLNNFADFSDVVWVKIKIKISSSRWWCFQLATSPIGAPCRDKDGAGSEISGLYLWSGPLVCKPLTHRQS